MESKDEKKRTDTEATALLKQDLKEPSDMPVFIETEWPNTQSQFE